MEWLLSLVLDSLDLGACSTLLNSRTYFIGHEWPVAEPENGAVHLSAAGWPVNVRECPGYSIVYWIVSGMNISRLEAVTCALGADIVNVVFRSRLPVGAYHFLTKYIRTLSLCDLFRRQGLVKLVDDRY